MTDTTRSGYLRREVAVLCVTEITAWGALFYALPVAAGTIAAERDWPLTLVLGAFTVAQLVAGLGGFWVGRHIDRVGPRGVMSVGSLLGAAALLAIGHARTPFEFYVAWALAGVAMSATLYAPAFAAITGWTRGDRRLRLRALTAVTLVAGLASTVFAPLTAWLLGPLGWQHTYVVLAAFVAVTAVAHAWGLREPWPVAVPGVANVGGPDRDGPIELEPFRRSDFWMLVAGMTLAGFAVSAVVVNLVPMLTEHGVGVREAAAVLGVGGAGQVAGRLFYRRIAGVTSSWARTWVVLAVVALTTVGLAEIHRPLVVVGALSFLGGAARGLFTLVQATSVSERWGPLGYGARNGILSGATMGAAAFAPWVGALLAVVVGGYGAAFWCLAAVAVLGAILVRPPGRLTPQAIARTGSRSQVP